MNKPTKNLSFQTMSSQPRKQRSRVLTACFAVAGILALPGAASAQEDLATEFNIANGSTQGNYTLGYVVNGLATVNPFPFADTDITDNGAASGLNELSLTATGDDTPGIFENPSTTSTATLAGQMVFDPRQIGLFSSAADLADVTYTAPTTGTYAISATFDRTNIIKPNADAGVTIYQDLASPTRGVLFNDADEFGSQSDLADNPEETTQNGVFDFADTLSLNAGETVDFLIDPSSGIVGFDADITAPEPSTWALLFVGFGTLFGMLHFRRKNA